MNSSKASKVLKISKGGKGSTKSKILDAAESLFADRGYAETSLRTITARADVNLASVNYHFGSKKSLIQAVFDRFIQGFLSELDKELAPLEQSEQPPTVEQVLRALTGALLKMEHARPNGSSNFMKLLGRAYSETQGHLRRFMQENYGSDLIRFTDLLHKAAPSVAPQDMFWRLHFMLGTVIFTLAGSDALTDIAQADFAESMDLAKTLDRLLPFLVAGFHAKGV